MKIKSAYVLNYESNGKINTLKLPFEEEQLDNLSNFVKNPSDNRIPDITDTNNENFNSPKRYSVHFNWKYVDDQNSTFNEENKDPQIVILENLFSKFNENNNLLQKSEDIFGKNKEFLYSTVVYETEELSHKANTQHLYLYLLKKSLAVSNRVGLFSLSKRIGSTKAHALEAQEVTDGFYLPQKDCVCSFHKKIVEGNKKAENVVETVKVYDGLTFSELFCLEEMRKQYAENTIDRFNDTDNPLTLTRDKVKVKFMTDTNELDIEKVKNRICNDDKLVTTFARFKGTKSSTIQKIGIDKLEQALDRLKAYVESDATAKFSIINIPSIDKEKLEIFVTEDQVPILAALLENKVIERILDKSIRVPYFE